MSKTGKVGTFGGQDIPPVTIYMDGWVAGVRYYDKQNNAHVKVLGWTPKAGRAKSNFAGNGLFTNDFTNQALGKTDTQTLIAQGADVIFPVAGVGRPRRGGSGQAGRRQQLHGVGRHRRLRLGTAVLLAVPHQRHKGIATSVSDAVAGRGQGHLQGRHLHRHLANGGVGARPRTTTSPSKIPASGDSRQLSDDQGRHRVRHRSRSTRTPTRRQLIGSSATARRPTGG